MTIKLELGAAGGLSAFAEFNSNSINEGSGLLLPFSVCDNEGRAATVNLSVDTLQTGGSFAPFVFKFVADNDIALSYFRVILPLPEKALYYGAACCTNAFAGIYEYEGEKTDKEFFARDIFMAQSGADCFDRCEKINVAFATFRRFYTRFRLCDGNVMAEFELENKAVCKGTEYELERIIIDDSQGGLPFFESYTDYLAKTHEIPEFKYIPKGWSSWSCYYGGVNEKRVLKQASLVKKELSGLGANLIQLDDGWQKEGSFGAYWTADYGKFPSGIEALGKKLRDNGQIFGIWMAPALVRDTSPLFDDFKAKDLLVKQPDGSLLKCFGGKGSLSNEKDGSIYALDIGKTEVLDMTREMFLRGKNEFGADYFKVDFITNLLYRVAFGTPVFYEGDYSVALYRRWISKIRKAVGDDTFLLSCGAPVGESIGVFDSIRVSPDISWGGAGKNGLPTPFEIITRDAQNVILRSPYHLKVFINDADALLVRNYLSEFEDDGLVLDDNEALLWATVVLFSGGHILLNEEIERLPSERLLLVKRTFELSLELAEITDNAAARPRDFFEFPLCTESYIPCNDGSFLCALYNWGEETCVKSLDVSNYFKGGECVTVKDIWSGEVLHSEAAGVVEFEIPRHGAVAVRLIEKLF